MVRDGPQENGDGRRDGEMRRGVVERQRRRRQQPPSPRTPLNEIPLVLPTNMLKQLLVLHPSAAFASARQRAGDRGVERLEEEVEDAGLSACAVVCEGLEGGEGGVEEVCFAGVDETGEVVRGEVRLAELREGGQEGGDRVRGRGSL